MVCLFNLLLFYEWDIYHVYCFFTGLLADTVECANLAIKRLRTLLSADPDRVEQQQQEQEQRRQKPSKRSARRAAGESHHKGRDAAVGAGTPLRNNAAAQEVHIRMTAKLADKAVSALQLLTLAVLGLAPVTLCSKAEEEVSVAAAGSRGVGSTSLVATFTANAPTAAAADADAAAVSTASECAWCRKTLVSPLRCSRCKAVFYCDQQHQAKHWAVHKVS
jgi:hypothetical protein